MLLVVGAGVVVLVVLNTVLLEVLTGLTVVVGVSVVLTLVVGLKLLAKLDGMKPSWLVSS